MCVELTDVNVQQQHHVRLTAIRTSKPNGDVKKRIETQDRHMRERIQSREHMLNGYKIMFSLSKDDNFYVHTIRKIIFRSINDANIDVINLKIYYVILYCTGTVLYYMWRINFIIRQS